MTSSLLQLILELALKLILNVPYKK